MQDNFFDLYFEYSGDTECPKLYHRWAAVSCISTFLGRDCYFPFGNFKIHPNMYVMLMGIPATRKSTAIKLAKKLLTVAGYANFAAEKTSKEKFLQDLAGQSDPTVYDDTPDSSKRGRKKDAAAILDQNLWGEDEDSEASRPPAELCIAADEFNDFIGNGDMEFASLLGTLWDYDDIYRNRIKSSKSLVIPYPTINILGGNTPVGFARAFPPEIAGQGFLSRLLLIHGEPTGRKITMPKEAEPELVERLVGILRRTKTLMRGRIGYSDSAFRLLDKIYQGYEPIDDVRFDAYCNRRFTHLLKLALICSAIRSATEIGEEDVRLANTILSFTEHMMPRALGEFGKAKNSDVSHKIMEVLNNATSPVALLDLWKHVHTDLERIGQLSDIINALRNADKIHSVEGKLLPKRGRMKESSTEICDFGLLTADERGY